MYFIRHYWYTEMHSVLLNSTLENDRDPVGIKMHCNGNIVKMIALAVTGDVEG